MHNLNRFLDAQDTDYACALSEIKSGRKHNHWMWYIFPQIKGLGYSSNANFYGISNFVEAKEYISHEILGARLIEISNALLKLEENDAKKIFGHPDNLKLKSCMTLFSEVSDNPVFLSILKKYFNGNKDAKTIEILGSSLHKE